MGRSGKHRRRGHWCWCCGGVFPNEAFKGGNHARHLCRQCSRLGGAELEYRQGVRNIERLLDWGGLIRRKHRKAFERFLEHPNATIRAFAEQVQAEDVLERAWRREEALAWAAEEEACYAAMEQQMLLFAEETQAPPGSSESFDDDIPF